MTRRKRRFFPGKNLSRAVFIHCQQVKDSDSAKKRVGVAENPRSGVGARGSSVKKCGTYGKICYTLPSIVLPLLNLLILYGVYLKIQNFKVFYKTTDREVASAFRRAAE
jgi:hypothetical protein